MLDEEVLKEVRLILVQLGVGPWHLVIGLPLTFLALRSPSIISALNERSRIRGENERLAKQMDAKIAAERERREKRRTKQ
ncbi:MAG: hypothetical protein O9248_00080 [Rhodobacteraceae bacterium]|nr:hypothetical protein [Paracoccaceae bacterium]